MSFPFISSFHLVPIFHIQAEINRSFIFYPTYAEVMLLFSNSGHSSNCNRAQLTEDLTLSNRWFYPLLAHHPIISKVTEPNTRREVVWVTGHWLAQMVASVYFCSPPSWQQTWQSMCAALSWHLTAQGERLQFQSDAVACILCLLWLVQYVCRGVRFFRQLFMNTWRHSGWKGVYLRCYPWFSWMRPL